MIDFHPVEFTRKEKSKYSCYELYSIKNDRNIKIYSQHCYYHALFLELDNNVLAYCERPNICCSIQKYKNNSYSFDFIVEYVNSKKLEMQHIRAYEAKYDQLKINYYEEEQWCKLHDYRYQFITLHEAYKNKYYLQNIKYLYGLLRRANSKKCINHINSIIQFLHFKKVISISEFISQYNIYAYDAFLAVAYGVFKGMLTIDLCISPITINTEVKLALNENSI